MKIGCLLLVVLVAIFYGLFLGGVSRKLTARMQNRRGPTVWQNFIDLWKVFRKQSIINHGIMYYIGPIFRFTGGVGTLLLIPVMINSSCWSNLSFGGDLFVILYFMFLGTLGMALGAGESAHPHSAIGISRGLALATASELPFLLAMVALMAAYNTASVKDIVIAQQGGLLHWNIFTHPFAAVAAFLAFLGMMGSYPFQIIVAPTEIPVGPATEYSSTHLSFMFSGGAVFGVAKYVLIMDLFLGGANDLVTVLWKTFLIFLWPLFITNVYPRFRTEDAVRFFWYIPALSGVIGLLIVIL